MNGMERKKYALVTGGGRGIGEAIALRLGKEGYNVALTYRNSETGAREVQRKLRELGSETEIFRADTSDLVQLNAAFDEYEKSCEHLDLLVNNAGVTLSASFLETTPELFDAVANTNLRGVYFMAQRAAKYMIKQGCEGSIINISSVQGSANFNNHSVYGSVKAAVTKLTRHIALELSAFNIRVNALSPGMVNVGGWFNNPDNPEVRKHIKKHETVIPLGSWACPEQVAGIIAFLASDDAIYITGEEIIADGGARLPVIMDTPAGWIPDLPDRAKSILIKQREN